MTLIRFHGGALDGRCATVSHLLPVLQVGADGPLYQRLVDPDTGAALNHYYPYPTPLLSVPTTLGGDAQ